jgi:hypothetical protein
MNTQLINSIVQMVQSLSKDEQQTLITKLNTLADTSESTDQSTNLEQKDAWDVFLSLGEEATPGQLDNPSVHHDRYLYQQPK